MITPQQHDAFERLLSLRSRLLSVTGSDDAGRAAVLDLETAIGALMPVSIIDPEAPALSGSAADLNKTVLAECFPNDSDMIAECLDALARGERFRGGGGATPIYEIERMLPLEAWR